MHANRIISGCEWIGRRMLGEGAYFDHDFHFQGIEFADDDQSALGTALYDMCFSNFDFGITQRDNHISS